MIKAHSSMIYIGLFPGIDESKGVIISNDAEGLPKTFKQFSEASLFDSEESCWRQWGVPNKRLLRPLATKQLNNQAESDTPTLRTFLCSRWRSKH